MIENINANIVLSPKSLGVSYAKFCLIILFINGSLFKRYPLQQLLIGIRII
jgi:hypothetical protein